MNTDGLTEAQKSVVQDVEQFLDNCKGYPLTPDESSKMFVALSYEMFNIDLEERGFDLLKRVDSNYFANKFRTDLKEDPDFAYLVSKIMGKLEEIGLVKITLLGAKDENSNS